MIGEAGNDLRFGGVSRAVTTNSPTAPSNLGPNQVMAATVAVKSTADVLDEIFGTSGGGVPTTSRSPSTTATAATNTTHTTTTAFSFAGGREGWSGTTNGGILGGGQGQGLTTLNSADSLLTADFYVSAPSHQHAGVVAGDSTVVAVGPIVSAGSGRSASGAATSSPASPPAAIMIRGQAEETAVVTTCATTPSGHAHHPSQLPNVLPPPPPLQATAALHCLPLPIASATTCSPSPQSPLPNRTTSNVSAISAGYHAAAGSVAAAAAQNIDEIFGV